MMDELLHRETSPEAAERIRRAGLHLRAIGREASLQTNRNARHVDSIFTNFHLIAVVALLPKHGANFVSIPLWRLKGMQARTTMFFARRQAAT
jgi:hypothetical protein